jgi:hypothetical protein
VFNPFGKTSQRAIQAMTDAQDRRDGEQQGIEREPTPLYSYPASYEHTLLPSGLRLASPFGSPALSPRIVAGFNGDVASAEKGPWTLAEGGWIPENGGRGVTTLEGGWIHSQTENDADNEESSSSDGSHRRHVGIHKPSASLSTTNIKSRTASNEEEDFCQVFAKTNTFDPFAADDYASGRLTSATPSIRLPIVAGVANVKETLLDQGDSARRMEETRGNGEKERDEDDKEAYFCGSSRYLMVSWIQPHYGKQ